MWPKQRSGSHGNTYIVSLLLQVPNSKVGGVSGSADDSVVRDDARVVLSEMTEVKSRQDHMTVKLENLKLSVDIVFLKCHHCTF